MADSEFDVIITDPPYNAHVHANMSSGTAMKHSPGGGIPRVELSFDPLHSYHWVEDLPRVARRWAISFCAVEDFGTFRQAVGAERWVRGGIWYKPNSMGQLTGDRPAAAYEGLAIMHRKTRKQWNGRGSYAYWSADSDEFPSEEAHFQCNGTRGEKGRHPNQKPLALCLELVAKFSNRGETVLDPFCGSGRIGEACVLLGRNYIGLDSDAAWVAAATTRLEIAQGLPKRADAECLRLCAAPKRVA
jgi:DNA modification methylase